MRLSGWPRLRLLSRGIYIRPNHIKQRLGVFTARFEKRKKKEERQEWKEEGAFPGGAGFTFGIAVKWRKRNVLFMEAGGCDGCCWWKEGGWGTGYSTDPVWRSCDAGLLDMVLSLPNGWQLLQVFSKGSKSKRICWRDAASCWRTFQSEALAVQEVFAFVFSEGEHIFRVISLFNIRYVPVDLVNSNFACEWGHDKLIIIIKLYELISGNGVPELNRSETAQ